MVIVISQSRICVFIFIFVNVIVSVSVSVRIMIIDCDWDVKASVRLVLRKYDHFGIFIEISLVLDSRLDYTNGKRLLFHGEEEVWGLEANAEVTTGL